jgi:hypothetical protein
MTGAFNERLEKLRGSTLSGVEQDLARGRERLIQDSFSFLRLAWEADASTYRTLEESPREVGRIVELYIGAEDREVPGRTSAERIYDISFAAFASEQGMRIVRFGFLLPKYLDFRDPRALDEFDTPRDVYVTQELSDEGELTQWVTIHGIETFIFGSDDDVDSHESFKSEDLPDEDADELNASDPQRAHEMRQTISLREALQRWQMIASSLLRVTNNGVELIDGA